MGSDMSGGAGAIEELESRLHAKQRLAKQIFAELNRTSRHLQFRAVVFPLVI